jgi:hypothetical protein
MQLVTCAMFQNPDAQGPGPPHRPHMPGAGDDVDLDEAPSAPTANTLSARAVLLDPHDGHFTFWAVVIERTSCSKFLSHDLQVYS